MIKNSAGFEDHGRTTLAARVGEQIEQACAPGHPVARCLLAWQETADETWLECVLATTTADLRLVARRVLQRHRVRDWSAVDDALSLVLDHLRRLPIRDADGWTVTRFDAMRRPRRGDGDSGMSYLAWLVRERSLDVVRQRRRQAARALRFAEQGAAATPCEPAFDADQVARLREAVGRLEPRQRAVVELLLAGRSQTAIAHLLDVCEGTVSRLRTRAITELRRLMG